VLDLALAASVMRLFKTPQCLGHFWDNAVQRAAWSGALAQAMGWNSDEAQLAGLLADIGVLVLAANTPGQDAFDWSSAPDPAVEVASFGVDRGRAGSELLFHWGLPAELVHPAEFHRSPTGGAHQTWTVPFVAAATALVDGADPDLAMTLAGLPNGLALKARESQLARLDGLHHVLR
jgi:HD-like signal output (HDOD) protein